MWMEEIKEGPPAQMKSYAQLMAAKRERICFPQG